jgi:hypothetical protein
MASEPSDFDTEYVDAQMERCICPRPLREGWTTTGDGPGYRVIHEEFCPLNEEDDTIDFGPGNPVAPTVSLREADQAASVVHDFVYGLNGVTKEQASVACWTIHNALRPLIAEETS